MNMFEQAARLKLRFSSAAGEITAEQLFDLPLQAKTGLDLDNVAKAVNKKLKEMAEESFVSTSTNPTKVRHELALEIVKHVIDSKIQAAQETKDRADKLAEKKRLTELLGEKQDDELKSLTKEELARRIAALG
jgi:hypothetical protein